MNSSPIITKVLIRILEAMGYRRLLYGYSTPFAHGRPRYQRSAQLADRALSWTTCLDLATTRIVSVDQQRWMLIDSLDMDWRTASESDRQSILDVAAKTGDLPRLSDVDIDLLALALANQTNLVTDDYRMKNVAREAGIDVQGVMTTGGKKQWKWVLRCIGMSTN